MSVDRAYHLLTHLTLALAGVCLACAEAPYVPDALLALPPYLALVALSWQLAGQRTLPAWAANLLGVAIAAAAALWIGARVGAGDGWMRDVPLPALVIPYLGPVLMALLLVRLFRPTSPDDFWLLQGLGLLQTALGCVLASGPVFALCLLAYLAAGVCALAAHERHAQLRAARRVADALAFRGEAARWLLFALRWGLGAALLAGPLFLLVPRPDAPEWEPLARFGVQQGKAASGRIGFSDEIDLTRTGRLERDDTPAFSVGVVSPAGRPAAGLPAEQRWRGVVLDHYEKGIWRSYTNWTDRGARPLAGTLDADAGVRWLHFRVPREAGWLFLADPVRLGPQPGAASVRAMTPARSGPGRRALALFYEVNGQVVPMTYLVRKEYQYTQAVVTGLDADRYPAPAAGLQDPYLRKLLENPAPNDLGPFTVGLALRLGRAQHAGPQFLAALERRRQTHDPLPPFAYAPAARMLCDHLRDSGEYTYSLEVRRESKVLDPVVDFLLNVKQGPCERYASALALMLRSLGAPARVVKGYRGAEYQGEGQYLVRNNTAHAWVEALAVGEGGAGYDWLVLDPTPEGDAPPAGSALERWRRSGKALWRDLIQGDPTAGPADLLGRLSRGLEAAVPWLSALAGLGGLVLLLGRRRWSFAATAAGAAGLYQRLLGLLDRHAGLRPRRAETPAELAARAAAWCAARPATAALAGVPAEVVAAYYADRFGGRALPDEELRRLGGRLAALRGTMR
jgi:hypothetical protein